MELEVWREEQLTIKEAVNQMEYRISTAEDIIGNQGLDDMRMAIGALKKRLPKKVVHRQLLNNFNNELYTICGNCPVCGSEGLLSTNTDYCNCCGQKLDWN